MPKSMFTSRRVTHCIRCYAGGKNILIKSLFLCVWFTFVLRAIWTNTVPRDDICRHVLTVRRDSIGHSLISSKEGLLLILPCTQGWISWSITVDEFNDEENVRTSQKLVNIGKYSPRGPRAISRAKGNLMIQEGCISQCIPTRCSVRPFSQQIAGKYWLCGQTWYLALSSLAAIA